MNRLPFSNPGDSRACDMCGHFADHRVQYVESDVVTMSGPVDHWLELTCRRCGFVREMECKS